LPRPEIISVEDNPDLTILELRPAVEDVGNFGKSGCIARWYVHLSRKKTVEKRFERILLGVWRRPPAPKRFQIGRSENSGVAGEENGKLRHGIVRKFRVDKRLLEILAL
jgi:hypothetical protein